jgi:hypothetical protein
MSRFVADHLTPDLLSRMGMDSAIERADVAIVICSIDEHGWAHPAMLSTLEVVAKDARNMRIATHVTSRTTRNLRTNGRVSLIVADEHAVYYVKGSALLVAASMEVVAHYAKFNVRVDSVLQDVPADYENARLIAGLRIERANLDVPAARAVLDELLTD